MKLKNGMIIKCNSKEDAQEFIKEAHKQGFKWVNYHEGDEEKTCWGYVCDFNSEIYYHLEADEITWSSMYSGNESIEYSTLKEKIKTMTKSDLKNGMVVELVDGSRALVINGLLVFEDGYQGLSSYKDDLTIKPFNNEMQINKVFKSKLYNLCDVLVDNLTLIWEREEKEEIKVGDKVKVINKDRIYNTFYKWVDENISNNFDKYKYDLGNYIPNGLECKVIHIAEHGGGINDTLAYIEDLNTKRCYLIGLKGLEKID